VVVVEMTIVVQKRKRIPRPTTLLQATINNVS